MAKTSRRKLNDKTFVIVLIFLWIVYFSVYLVNTPEPTFLGGLSRPYTYSLLWWVVALLIFVSYATYDIRGD